MVAVGLYAVHFVVMGLVSACSDGDLDPVTAEVFTPAWTQHLFGDAFVDSWAHQLAFDSDGDLVVLVSDATDTADGCTAFVRFTADGSAVWHRAFEQPVPALERCPSHGRFALDASGGATMIAYVYRTTDASGVDIFVRAHSALGHPRWTTFYDGGAEGLDLGRDIAVGPDGTVVAVGAVAREHPHYVPWIAAYSSDGILLWHDIDEGVAAETIRVEVDTAGNIITMRELHDPHANPTGLVIRKLDNSGALIWEHASAASFHYLSSFAITPTGESLLLASDPNATRLRKVSAEGVLVWETVLSRRPCRSTDGYSLYGSPEQLAVTPNGSVLAAGGVYISRGGGVDDPVDAAILIQKFDAGGNWLWARYHELGLAEVSPIVYSIALDDAGNLALAFEIRENPDQTYVLVVATD